jgi:hypothetical protein
MTALNRARIDAGVDRHCRWEMEDDESWRIQS